MNIFRKEFPNTCKILDEYHKISGWELLGILLQWYVFGLLIGWLALNK